MAEAAGRLKADLHWSSSTSYETDESSNDRTQQWQGPASTWRAYNAQEISNATALEEIRDRDLSLHLYNAFALRKRHGTSDALARAPVPSQDIDADTGQVIKADTWVPPFSWTAWPLSTSRVPAPDFLRRQQRRDPAECFTVRMPAVDDPGLALRDALAGSVLRFAKEHFNLRGWQSGSGDDGDSSGVDDDAPPNGGPSHSCLEKARPDFAQNAPRTTDINQLDDKTDTETSIIGEGEGLFVPSVSANDDVSHEILRPCIRHILSRLDSTLDALHNAQEAATSYFSDISDSDSGRSTRSRQSKRRSASRDPGQGQRKTVLKHKFIQEFVAQWDPDADVHEDSKPLEAQAKRGRPKKRYPRQPGENDTDYVIRVSRMRKLRIPVHMTVVSSPSRLLSSAPGTETSEAEYRSQTPRPPKTPRFSERRRAQLDPRDWTDVMSAASLGGFSAEVLDRAARRCAHLFGQQMVFHTFEETRHDQESCSATENYHADMPMPRVKLADVAENDFAKREMRQISRFPPSVPAGSDGEQASSRGRTTSRSRAASARSRSASASAGQVFHCKIPECPRFRQPFPRQSNMVRHMKQVHNIKIDVDVDSEDEMYGAAHVDGFMKPIRIRPGWRRGVPATPAHVMHGQRKRKRGR
ncbi:RNA polymerase I specific transcription initiation factor [Microdochium nivale]|nr:RNA polymerase I specific transcription initiation factor [Microdochium nivale]